MKVVLLGTKRDKILDVCNKSDKELDDFENKLALKLVGIGDIIFVPDSGVPSEIAEKTNSLGAKTIAVLPSNDTRYGISHITLPSFAKIEYPRKTWYELNAEITTLGDIVVVVGLSGGVLIELSYIKYLNKFGIANPKVYLFKQWVSSIPVELLLDVNINQIESPSELV